MSLGLKTVHRPSPSTPYRPITTSPILITDTSTQMTQSPRSLITPSPKAFRSDFGSGKRDLFLSTQDSDSSGSYRNPNNSLALWESREYGPKTTPRKTLKQKEILVKTSPKKGKTTSAGFVVRREYNGLESKLALYAKERKQLVFSDVDRELKAMYKSVEEKEALIEELQSIITELEERLKAERTHSETLQQENEELSSQLRRVESEVKAKFSAEIEKLTLLLSENSKKVVEISQKMQKSIHRPSASHSIPPKFTAPPDSVDFSMFLLGENKRLADEMSEARATLQRNYTTLLTSLIAELASVRHDMSQLRTLLGCIKAGELVQLDVLWSTKAPSDPPRSSSLSTECLKEISAIKDCTAEMRKVASSFYAEQCGQACSTQ